MCKSGKEFGGLEASVLTGYVNGTESQSTGTSNIEEAPLLLHTYEYEYSRVTYWILLPHTLDGVCPPVVLLEMARPVLCMRRAACSLRKWWYRRRTNQWNSGPCLEREGEHIYAKSTRGLIFPRPVTPAVIALYVECSREAPLLLSLKESLNLSEDLKVETG